MKNFENFTKGRIEAFSDGVFAIVVTLLVFDIKLSKPEFPYPEIMISEIIQLFPKILSWISSFLIVCVIWMNHHRIFNMISYVDFGVFWLNNILLMFTSLIPFPTGIMGTNFNNPFAVAFYGICLSFAALSFSFLRLHILKKQNIRNTDMIKINYRKDMIRSLFFGPLLYLTGAASVYFSIWTAFAVYIFIPIYFIIPQKEIEENNDV
ncbi:MAG TPA: TMEM175 family protein [Leptospiraceae bacterium]|nr:TMEM175 family protein [Leptospiraceae bacterium]HNF26191.1 TMEM175 family protein [Leptospiraceae bacterium]HNI97071.1 TMEM175 family protein [Leptospiraceae bacterium]HNM03594.1 TMEM175 family protein [Leptospiraceae bacterium]HNN05873.1 TMEM175 family protein [Leptospiraceae bacterium]